MIVVHIIFTTLVTTALARGDMKCNLSESTGAQQCMGTLGKPLIFYLPMNPKEIIFLKKNTVTILQLGKNKSVSIEKTYSNHSVFFTNGTFKLDKATTRDSGDYQLETNGLADGLLLHTLDIHVEILAPVSQPLVSQMCLSPEQMKVSCSSEGDGVEFILTLDNNILLKTRAGSTEKHHTPNVTISLHGQVAGNLMCNVQNNVSREQKAIHLTSCKGSISHLSLGTVAVIASVATLLLLLALFLGVKHLNKKTRQTTVNADNAEDEIVYSDVKVMQTRKTRINLHKSAT